MKYPFLTMALFVSIGCSAQFYINGTVTDVDNRPIPYANVVWAGTEKGTVTNEVGEYAIGVTNIAGKLEFSALGRIMKAYMAGAAERGFISGDAEQLYAKGIADAFAYWQTVLPDGYLTANAYGANGANPIVQIITQKWIANMINGYEGWIEYRRTGFPELKTISASLNNDLIPVRIPYPAEEEALNSTNYADASAKTDGNSINVKVWWDEAP